MRTRRGSNRARLAGGLAALLLGGCAAPEPLPDDELASRLNEHNLLLVPVQQAPRPAVMLLHTCYGNLGHVDRWARDLQAEGYVALVVNSMRARRLEGFLDRMRVCSGGVMTARDRARDVALGLRRLRGMAAVDPARIGLVGFSHGGWTLLEFLASDRAGAVKAAALVYPYCGADARESVARWPRDVEILMLLAGNDTTVGTAECEMLAAALRERGIPVTLHVYPGARHGFDIDPRLIYGYDRRYDPRAAADARRRILRALESTIGRAG